MKTLKDLFWSNAIMSKRFEAKANRKGMVYLGKCFENIPTENCNYLYLGKLLQAEGICAGNLPQRSIIAVDETTTLIITHVKQNSKMYEALKAIGFEE